MAKKKVDDARLKQAAADLSKYLVNNMDNKAVPDEVYQTVLIETIATIVSCLPVGGEALPEAILIRMKKAQDYNAGPVKLEDYFPFGLTSYAHEIHKKSLRLVALASSGKMPANESVRDTLLDMINYCTFAVEDHRS